VIFQDFAGPGIFKKKNLGLSRRRGNPAENNYQLLMLMLLLLLFLLLSFTVRQAYFCS